MDPNRLVLCSLAMGMLFWPEVHAAAPGTEKQEIRTPDALKAFQDKSASARQRSSMAEYLGHSATSSEIQEFGVDAALLAATLDKNEDPSVRQECVKALGRLVPRAPSVKDRYMEPFLEMLGDKQENSIVRKRIVEAFRDNQARKGLNDDRAFALLIRIVTDKTENPLVRIGAVDAIGSFNIEKSITVLADLLGQIPAPTEPLKSAVVKSFSRLLTNVPSTQAFGVPTINRISEFAKDSKHPPDLRANAFRTLARLKAKNAKGLDGLPEDIRKILEEENEMKVLLAAVEAAGILGEETLLEPLQNTVRAFAHDEKQNAIAQTNRMLLRVAVMDSLGEVLSRQSQKPNAAAISKCTDMLLEAIKVGENMETLDVQRAAIFSLQYLCPNKKDFQAQHKRALEALLERMRPVNNPSEEMLNAIVKTLEAITEQPFETDLKRWEEYLKKGN